MLLHGRDQRRRTPGQGYEAQDQKNAQQLSESEPFAANNL